MRGLHPTHGRLGPGVLLLAAPVVALVPALGQAPDGPPDPLRDWLRASCEDPGAALEVLADEPWVRPSVVEGTFELLGADASAEHAGCPPEVRRALLLAILEHVPFETVRARAARASRPGATTDERVVALDVLAHLADEGTVEEMLLVASGEDRTRDLDRAFDDALTTALESSARFRRDLRTHAREVPGELVPLAARALGRAGGAAHLGPLAGWLGASEERDALLLGEVARLATRVGPPFEERVLVEVRFLLDAISPRVQAAAARASGALEDPAAVPALLELMDASEAAVRGGARGALEQISGVRLGPDVRRWRSWYATEQAWWQSEYDGVLADLQEGNPPAVVAAIRALSTHRLYRDELATVLEELLLSPYADRRLMACTALGQFRTRAAGPALVACLTDTDDRVAEQACVALQTIFGRDLPPDVEAWREVVENP